MRACFLGQNVTALGFGVAMLQVPPLPPPPKPKKPARDALDEVAPPRLDTGKAPRAV